MNSELATIARELAALYVQRGDLVADRIFAKSRMAEIEAGLPPPEGKNEMERKADRQKMLMFDDEWRELDRIQRDNEAETVKVDAQIQALEARRRGREWEIRAALAGYTLRHDGDEDPDEAAANSLTDAPAAYSVQDVRRINGAFDRFFGDEPEPVQAHESDPF